MAAYTSSQAGNWSATSTWGGIGPPGNGDTATILHNVTADIDVTVGSSPATGGTPAITIGAGGSVAHTGGTLTAKGDIKHTANSSWTMSAGTSVVFYPAPGAQYKWDFNRGFSNLAAYLFCNGTAGSRCAVSTSAAAIAAGGLPAYFGTDNFASHVDFGLITASYTDFINIGDSTHFGIISRFDAVAGDVQHNYSVTNCTFTACSLQSNFGSSHDWDGNVTFTGNTFSSSVAGPGSGGNAPCLQFDGNDITPAGTRTFSGNRFDIPVLFVTVGGFAVSDNLLVGHGTTGSGLPFGTTGTWTHALGSFDSNLLYYGAVPATPVNLPGDCTNSFFQIDDPSGANNHVVAPTFVGSNKTTYNWKGNIYAANNDGNNAGHWFFSGNVPSVATVWNVEYNITLPRGDDSLPGDMIVTLGNIPNLTINVRHNTPYVQPLAGGTDGMVAVAHLQTTVGQPVWGEVSANLCWTRAAGTNAYVVFDLDGSSLVDIVAASACKNNGQYHIKTAPDAAHANSGNGYDLTLSTSPPSSDVTADPQFVDSTRNLKTWGVAQGLTTPTEAQVLAYLQDPANGALSTLIPSLMSHVRGGVRPYNAAYAGASYAGDPSTADAAGNAWAGGSTPDIGAMAQLVRPSATFTVG